MFPLSLPRTTSALGCLQLAIAFAQPPEPPEATEHRLAPVRVQGTRIGGQYSGQNRDGLGLGLGNRELPQSISVITAAQLSDFGLRNANDALSHVTGVTVERFETDRSSYTARGFDITNFQFDGVGLPFTNGDQLGDIDTAVFEQIDVLHGANGLLSATGNPSATVNFVRKRPTATRRADIGLTLGSWRDRRVDVDLSGPLAAEGRLRGRLIAMRARKNSYLDRYGVDKHLLSGQLDIDLGERTGLSMGYLTQRNDADRPMWGALPLVYSDGGPMTHPVSASTAPDWAFWDNDDSRTHARLTHEFESAWTLEASILARELAYEAHLFYVTGHPDRDTLRGLGGEATRSSQRSRQRMADLRLSGPFRLGEREHRVLLGFNWGREHTRALSKHAERVDLTTADLGAWAGRQAPPDHGGSRRSEADFDTARRSLYGAVHAKPTERLGLILGANLNEVGSEGENYGIANQYHNRVATPYVGLTYDLSEAASAYASFGRIFSPQIQADEHRRPIDPAQGSNLEAGLKAEWLGKRMVTSLAVFRTRQDNTAEFAGTLSDLRPYFVGVNTRSTGFEIDFNGRPAPGWELSAGYVQMSLRDDAGRAARSFIPRRTLRGTWSWQTPAVPGLRVGMNVRWQSEVRTLVDQFPVVQKAYALFDVMASYELGTRTRLTFNLNNVRDTRYLGSLRWQWAYHGAPRNLALSLHSTF